MSARSTPKCRWRGSNSQLQEALTRLSTGLRINSGKDDPAGLIASEILRSDIVGTQKAISNSQQANQMIATADSALGQVSSLLDDIRGLVEEAANKGAMSDSQIAANQLQLDSSLQAIDRISQTTQFQGRALLDGNLDFVSQNVDATKMGNLQVNQANFGTASQIDTQVDVGTQATQAALTFKGNQLTQAATLEVGGSQGFQTFSFDAGTTVQQIANAINLVSDATGVDATLANRVASQDRAGAVKMMNSGATDGYSLTANTAGQYPGDYTVNYVKDTSTTTTSAKWMAGSPNVIQINAGTQAWAKAGAAAAPVSVGEGTNGMAIAANIAGSQFNHVGLRVVTGGLDTAAYDYATNLITVNTTIGTKASAAAAPVSIGEGTNGLTLAANTSGTAFNGAHVTLVNGGANTATWGLYQQDGHGDHDHGHDGLRGSGPGFHRRRRQCHEPGGQGHRYRVQCRGPRHCRRRRGRRICHIRLHKPQDRRNDHVGAPGGLERGGLEDVP